MIFKKIFVVIFVIVLSVLSMFIMTSYILNLPMNSGVSSLVVWVVPSGGFQEYKMLENNYSEQRTVLLNKRLAFDVDPGDVNSYATFSRLLSSGRFIKNDLFFGMLSRFISIKKNIMPGFHFIDPTMSTLEILKELSTFHKPNEILTVYPGDNISNIAANIKKHLSGKSFNIIYDSLNDKKFSEELKTVYGIANNSGVEGFFYPGVYQIFPKIDSYDYITKHAVSNFYLEIGRDLVVGEKRDINKIITKASCLEKKISNEDKQYPLCSPSLSSILISAKK